MKPDELKKQLIDRMELADETTAALEKFTTSLAALHRHQTSLLRELRKAGVRIDNVRWLEGDTAGLALEHLRASMGQGQPPKTTLSAAVEKENAAIEAAIRTADDYHSIVTRGRSWAGSHHAAQRDYSNLR